MSSNRKQHDGYEEVVLVEKLTPSAFHRAAASVRKALFNRHADEALNPVLLRAMRPTALRKLHREEQYFLEQFISYQTVLANARKYRMELANGQDIASQALACADAMLSIKYTILDAIDSAPKRPVAEPGAMRHGPVPSEAPGRAMTPDPDYVAGLEERDGQLRKRMKRRERGKDVRPPKGVILSVRRKGPPQP